MKIVLDPAIALRLMTIGNLTRGQEFSGLGFCIRENGNIRIYDVVVMNIGSEVYTEISTQKLLPLLDREDAGNMKVWTHKHPMGDGVPGMHNWSATDQATIVEMPLGGMPEMVKWSVSIVLTPKGWVGRVDNHITHKTIHCPVEPQSFEAYATVNEIGFSGKVYQSYTVLPRPTAGLWYGSAYRPEETVVTEGNDPYDLGPDELDSEIEGYSAEEDKFMAEQLFASFSKRELIEMERIGFGAPQLRSRIDEFMAQAVYNQPRNSIRDAFTRILWDRAEEVIF